MAVVVVARGVCGCCMLLLQVVLQKLSQLEPACKAFLAAGDLAPQQYGDIRKQALSWLSKQKPVNALP